MIDSVFRSVVVPILFYVMPFGGVIYILTVKWRSARSLTTSDYQGALAWTTLALVAAISARTSLNSDKVAICRQYQHVLENREDGAQALDDLPDECEPDDGGTSDD